MHFPLPKTSSIFLYFYVFIASGKVWFGFTRAHRAAGLCCVGEVGVQVPVAFEGSSILCQSKSSPPTHPWDRWAPWRCRDKSQWVTQSESASAHHCWGLWCRHSHSSARRKGQIQQSPGGCCGQPGWLGAQQLPAVPRDPRAAGPPGALPAPGFSHAYTAAIHFMQQNKPCRKRPPHCRAFPRRQWV